MLLDAYVCLTIVKTLAVFNTPGVAAHNGEKAEHAESGIMVPKPAAYSAFATLGICSSAVVLVIFLYMRQRRRGLQPEILSHVVLTNGLIVICTEAAKNIYNFFNI